MKKISSGLTSIYRDKYQYLIFLIFIFLFFLYFYFKLNNVLIFIGIAILCFMILVWFLNLRKLKDVFIEKDKIIVDNVEIFFHEIISLNQSMFTYDYKIVYKKNNKIESFIFLPKFTIPFFIFFFIKEIKKGMNK